MRTILYVTFGRFSSYVCIYGTIVFKVVYLTYLHLLPYANTHKCRMIRQKEYIIFVCYFYLFKEEIFFLS
jgi:hypothetical protein